MAVSKPQTRVPVKRAGRPRRKVARVLLPLLALILLLSGVIYYNTHKPLPAGLSVEGPVHRVKDIDFLYDLTYKQGGTEKQEQSIYNRVFQAVDEAEKFIVLDIFLFNEYYDHDQSFPPLSQTLTEKLIARKKAVPGLQIVFITDEVNTTYGSHAAANLEQLKANGIDTVITDVDPLRDSTPLYSGVWRTFLQWFGQAGDGWLKNPMADTAPKITVRSYMKLFNVKANHRKVIATDKTVIIPSANAHDASANHSNAALQVSGPLIADVLASEQAAINLGGGPKVPAYTAEGKEEGDIRVQLLTEGGIYRQVLRSLDEAGAGDKVWMGMFYLADREIIDGLLEASKRGAEVNLILDPNQNAFGRDKIGIPNRPVASELLDKSGGNIHVRWYNTGKEQYHTKLLFIDKPGGVVIHNGSANFTKRNLDDLNLETNLGVTAPKDSEVAGEVRRYFDRLWNNEGAEFTLDYEAYRDKTVPLKKAAYAVQTFLGFTTF
ncbi:phospholipase D family protein [Paenibacillus aurantius]|uniref:phospholipase D n=1 Tax=Paenibacillus aurantius TaxID=2918900 RepID=A0AA96LCV0_9BACL|nr:phospholipase D family protein [Paenibacillus aurantius]WNQ11316.1 phospholipase D family protein [Paenibacillus aurantius]